MPSAPFSNVLSFLRQVARPEGDTDAALLGRFIERRDEQAFEALVWRHGAMVLTVCQRIVGDPHLAEDGFQATFLVLAQRATTIADRRCLAAWLHGVAVRVARKARGQEAQRKARLMTLPTRLAPAEPRSRLDDVKPILDEEIDRLPPRYRELVVLCYLQGKTNAEAARELGCPEGTVYGRLARARRMLHHRLVRRGVALSAAAVVAGLGPEAQASLSPVLVSHATAVLTGPASASPTALTLAHEVMRTMLWTSIMKMTVLAVMFGALTATIGVLGSGTPGTSRAVAKATPLRPGEQKDKAPETAEVAIARGLDWLAAQEADGSWPGDNKVESTSLALLALLGSGNTNKHGIVEVQPKYAKQFDRGLRFLLTRQIINGAFDANDQVVHAKATMAVCEAYVLSLDPGLKRPAQRAIDVIVKAQKKSGGWAAQAGKQETMTATAWQIMALRAGEMGGMGAPMDNWKDTQMFLADCGDRKTGTTGAYAETPALARDGKFTPAATAMGLRCRQLQGWKPDHPVFSKGIEWLAKQAKPKDLDVDALFFTTQVFRDVGGDKAGGWNRGMAATLLKKQQTEGKDRGSWGPEKGRLTTTALSILSLEVYYRKLPTFFRELRAEGEGLGPG
jgi:RNA polymerase sigma factor (sigma-70 family)